MIIFNDWNISYSGGYVARQYDNLSRYILVTGAPLEYEWDLLVKSRELFNTIPLKSIEEKIGELLTAEQLSIAGEYKIQLRGTLKSDTRVKRHTNIITIYIGDSLYGDKQWPDIPSALIDIEKHIKQISTPINTITNDCLNISFNNWELTSSDKYIGRQYDNLSRSILITNVPSGYNWDILVKNNDKYNVIQLSDVDGGIGTTFISTQLSMAGGYQIQLRGTLKSDGKTVQHTNIITVYVDNTLSGNDVLPNLPDEFTQIENNIKELNLHPPVPGPNGYWMLWDIEQHKYIESEFTLPSGPGGSYRIGYGLKLDIETNTLSVDTADKVEADNTKPITSAAVHAEVGNIEVLLAAL